MKCKIWAEFVLNVTVASFLFLCMLYLRSKTERILTGLVTFQELGSKMSCMQRFDWLTVPNHSILVGAEIKRLR